MKLKLLLQILLLSSVPFMMQATPVATANPQSLTVEQNNLVTFTLSGAGTGTLTYNVPSISSKGGTITPYSVGSEIISYISATGQDALGLDSFAFTVTDDNGTSSPATVYIQVLPTSLIAYVTDVHSVSDGQSQISIVTGVGSSPTANGTISNVPTNYQNATDLVVTPNGTKAYICYPNLNKVSVVDTQSNNYWYDISDSSGPLADPQAIAISPNGMTAYVCNKTHSGNTAISIFSPLGFSSDQVTGYVTDSSNYIRKPIAVAFTPDGTRAYVASSLNNSVTMINVSTNTATTRISSGLVGILTDIVIAPNGNFAYIVSESGGVDGNGAVYIIDTNPAHSGTTYNTVIGSITDADALLNYPTVMAISPDGSKAYVINSGDDTISVVDMSTVSVTGSVAGSFNESDSIIFTANGLQAYVTNHGSQTISIITTSNDTVATTLSGYSGVGFLGFIGDVPYAYDEGVNVDFQSSGF